MVTTSTEEFGFEDAYQRRAYSFGSAGWIVVVNHSD
jgi:hypothetical protein